MQALLLFLLILAACSEPAVATDAGPGVAVDANPLDADLRPPPVCHIALDCGGVAIPDQPKLACTIVIEDGTGGVVYDGSVGVEKRGRSSQSFPKPQYAIELRVAQDDPADRPENLLGMGKEADWVLNGAYIDRSLLRNKLLFDLFQSFGGTERYAPELAYCTLQLDGDDRGIYLLTERIKRDDDRVAIAADENLNGSSFIIKQGDGGGFANVGTANGQWRLIYPNAVRATPQQVQGVRAWLDVWNGVLTGADTQTDLFTLVDLGSAVDFVLLEELAKNNDAYFLSMHTWKAPGGRLHFTPWDLDLSFGQPDYNNSESPEGWVAHRPALISEMAKRPAFASALATRWTDLRQGVLATEAVLSRFDFHVETIAGSVAQNFERWPIESIQFLGNTLYEVESYEQELALVRAWIQMRLLWMDGNIQNYSQ